MEITAAKYKNFERAYKALRSSIDVLHMRQKSPDASYAEIQNHIAGTVQHFEMAYETCWKFLKIYLEIKYDVEENSPKSVFKACFKTKILDEATVDELIQLANDRNETAHIYDEDKAKKLCSLIEKHYSAFGTVLQKVTIHQI